jgi:hypothetical protein
MVLGAQQKFSSFDNRRLPMYELNFRKHDGIAGNPNHDAKPICKIVIIVQTFARFGYRGNTGSFDITVFQYGPSVPQILKQVSSRFVNVWFDFEFVPGRAPDNAADLAYPDIFSFEKKRTQPQTQLIALVKDLRKAAS